MIFPVQLIININAQVFTAANLFNVIITQLESEVMFFVIWLPKNTIWGFVNT